VNTPSGSRPSTDEYFLQMAELVACRGTCSRRRVGCVLVDRNNHVLSTGYNGVSRGSPHCTDRPCMGAGLPSGEGLHLCQAIHAEINALVQCRNIDDIYSVYTTSSPCVLCMRVIVGTGVKRIVFREAYPHVESYLMAKERDIEWLLLPK
jgi:dCMP deaminase